MPYCEMCGAEQESLTTVKISHSELDVCDDCAEIGTPVEGEAPPSSGDEETEDQTNVTGSVTRNSTSSTETESTSEDTNYSAEANRQDNQSSDFETTALRADYGDVLRDAREEHAFTLADLAEQVGEKESHIRKIEQGDRRPTAELQENLEDVLEVDLSAGQTGDASDYSNESSERTLGDASNLDL